MKGIKFVVLLFSILLLTISSGLLFYKNLFLMERSGFDGKVDFIELRTVDLQINATTAMMRRNLSSDQQALLEHIDRIKELLNIITEVNKTNNEISQSVKKIQVHFTKKMADLLKFQAAITELKSAVESLNSEYNELIKNKITFTVDKRDFYRESVVDALFYLSAPYKENEIRLTEDMKILSQIIAFAKAPNPLILKFSNSIETLSKRNKEIDKILDNFNHDSNIAPEINTVGRYLREAQIERARDGKIFLTLVFGAIVLYLICIAVVLQKLN